MTDIGFPGQHTTTTTVQTTKTPVQNTIYIRTRPGILKILQMVLNLLGFICIEASDFSNHGRGSWFNLVAVLGLLLTGTLFVLYLYRFIEKLPNIPWGKLELIFCLTWTVFYLIAASLAVTYYNGAYIAAGIFGFCAMVVYGIDAFINLMSILNSS